MIPGQKQHTTMMRLTLLFMHYNMKKGLRVKFTFNVKIHCARFLYCTALRRESSYLHTLDRNRNIFSDYRLGSNGIREKPGFCTRSYTPYLRDHLYNTIVTPSWIVRCKYFDCPFYDAFAIGYRICERARSSWHKSGDPEGYVDDKRP